MAEMTQSRVRALFNYDEETGLLYWKERPRSDFRNDRAWKITNSQRAGKLVSAKSKMGKNTYMVVRIDDVLYLQHRLIWLYVHGRWPANLIDHKNGVGTDNRIDNLREADYRQNHANRTFQGKTLSGFKGVYPNGKRWEASISVDNRIHRIGVFDDPAEAHEAYMVEARKRFGEFARAV